jgi:hypothetical protein
MSRIMVVCTLFLLIATAVVLIPPAYADVPPPIECVETETGGLYCIASNISLPKVAVNVTIHLTDSWRYDLNVSCAFTISSQIEQNLTTAFVYPSIWTHFTPEQNASMHEFDIRINDTSIEYTIFNFDDFKTWYDLNQTDWQYVMDCDFALFNFSIGSVNPIVVDVFASFSSFSAGHEFIFEYIVDTARRWEGDTHETIQLQFDRDNESEIIEYRYQPNSNLDFSGNNYSAALTWDFSIHDFEYDRVSFIVQQREYPVYHHVWPPNPRDIMLAVGAVVVLVMVGSTLVMKRQQH